MGTETSNEHISIHALCTHRTSVISFTGWRLVETHVVSVLARVCICFVVRLPPSLPPDASLMVGRRTVPIRVTSEIVGICFVHAQALVALHNSRQARIRGMHLCPLEPHAAHLNPGGRCVASW